MKDLAKRFLPCFMNGIVVHGFQRGSKQLGCPTANLSDRVTTKLDPTFPYGVYFGYASVDNGPVYRMVLSCGTNPHFHNTKKTIEAHLLHEFPNDFYGSILKIVVLGYLREMASFKTIDELKEAIRNDINSANKALDYLEEDGAFNFKEHDFFKIIDNCENVIYGHVSHNHTGKANN
uniref:riboflavin kinase n=1 Tax=Romanomermis culicivorax TaxID=13658 RepID=A0A915KG97_ROMCU